MKRGSAFTGRLPRGCELCEKGAKLVLLVTGRCARRCWYCPLSLTKKGRDVFFANEKKISRLSEAIEEARLIDALGTGITGGDPMLAMNRTVRSIKALKRAFGDEHHIHLYTSTADVRTVRHVARAGLDEIRFHPPVRLWKRLQSTLFAEAIAESKQEGMAVGIELPAIPGRRDELSAVVSFASSVDLDFVNLNELEFSETNWKALRSLGMGTRDDLSAGVDGSEAIAMELLEEPHTVSLHYCSSGFKDGVQLRNRIGRRARNVQKAHEIVSTDSTLVKGVIETEDIPGAMARLREEHEVPEQLMWHDRDKNRLEVAAWVLEDIASGLALDAYIVEEYPTADRLEVERRPLMPR